MRKRERNVCKIIFGVLLMNKVPILVLINYSKVILSLHVVQPDARVSFMSLALAKTIWFC